MINTIQKSGNNPKPLILHSIRVFALLDILNYNKNILIASLLHDCIEDTDTTETDITKTFNKKIAELVTANTFNKQIKDKTERYKELFSRCKEKRKKCPNNQSSRSL